MVRVHSSCMTGDILGSLRCDCGDQLHRHEMIEVEGKAGVIHEPEGRGIGLLNKLKAYKLNRAWIPWKQTCILALAWMNVIMVGAQILREMASPK